MLNKIMGPLAKCFDLRRAQACDGANGLTPLKGANGLVPSKVPLEWSLRKAPWHHSNGATPGDPRAPQGISGHPRAPQGTPGHPRGPQRSPGDMSGGLLRIIATSHGA